MAAFRSDSRKSGEADQRVILRRILVEAFGRMRWLFVLIPVMVTIVLGGWGFSVYSLDGNPPLSFPDNLYQTLLLFFFASGSVTGPLPWPLEIARWMAPALLAWATIKAILFLAQRQMLLLRLRTRRGHVLLIGAKTDLERLPASFGGSVVILDTESDLEEVVEKLDDGTPVLAASLGSEHMMKSLNLHKASYVLLMHRDDEENISNTLRMRSYMERNHRSDHRVVCFAHISDMETELMLSEQPEFQHEAPGFEVRLFNLNRIFARSLFELHAPDICRPITTPSAPPAHILLVGNGGFGRHILQQALRTGHYCNGTPQMITIVDLNAARQEGRLRSTFEAIDELACLSFLERDAGSLRSEELASLQMAAPFSVVYIAAGDDAERMHIAMRLRDKLQDSVRIVVCLSQAAGLTHLFAQRKQGAFKGRHIHFFSMSTQMSDSRLIVDEELDCLAKIVHREFLAKYENMSETDQPWNRLSSDKKNSNRHQADHMAVKLRAVGLEIRTKSSQDQPHVLTKSEIEIMAKMEHRRWMSDKILAGWKYGIPTDGKRQDENRKMHASMVPYDELPCPEQEKDLDAVRLIPELLELGGKAVYASALRKRTTDTR